MLIFQIKRNTFLIFFENAKNLVRSDDAEREKKGGWPYKTWQS